MKTGLVKRIVSRITSQKYFSTFGFSFNNPIYWDRSNGDLSGGGGSLNPLLNVSQQTALQLSTYFACINNISSDLATIPIDICKTLPSGEKQKRTDGKVYKLLNQSPNEFMTPFSFKQTMFQWCLGWGNAIALIDFNDFGDPVALWPIPPHLILPKYKDGVLFYEVFNDPESPTKRRILQSWEVFHLKGLGNGYWGYSIMAFQAESLGVSLATQKFASTFFSQGALAGHVVSSKKTLGEEGRKSLEDSIRKFRNTENWHKILFLEDDLLFNTINIPLRDAQFIETVQFQTEDICRWFRMPLSMVQSSKAEKLPIEGQQIDYVKFTLNMWLVRNEQETQKKLLATGSSFRAISDVSYLLRGDLKTMAEYLTKIFNLGGISPNEVSDVCGFKRGKKDGDKRFLQVNMQPIEKICSKEQPPPRIDNNAAPIGSGFEEEDEEDQEDEEDEINSLALGLNPVLAFEVGTALKTFYKIVNKNSSRENISKARKTLSEHLRTKLTPLCQVFDSKSIARLPGFTKKMSILIPSDHDSVRIDIVEKFIEFLKDGEKP